MAATEKILPKDGEQNVLITSALPYVNNVPHLGNIVGSVLSADVFARYNRARGRPTLFICGTDEFGTATETKALEEGCTPQELCDKYYKIHADIYEWFEIGFDVFGRTSTAKQKEITQDIFRKLYAKHLTIQRGSRQPYCEKHKAFLADRYIEGTCPKCGYEDARGDQCDRCGSVDYEPLDLLNPRCKLDPDVTPVARDTKHIHLRLDELQPAVESWVTRSAEEGAWSRNGRIITESWLKTGLRDRAITRDLRWGVPVPLDVFADEAERAIYADKVFYVWFDACIGYVSITATYTPEWERWWRNPEHVRLYQFLGKDNVPFHSVVFPACQIGTGDVWTKVHHLSATEYLNYENGKFSKSRGIGVFGNNAKDTGIAADVWRYYLIKSRPETSDTQFEWRSFIENNNSELLAKLGNLVNRVVKLVNSAIYDSRVPDHLPHLTTPAFAAFLADINSLLARYRTAMDAASLRAGLAAAMAIAQAGNNFLQSHAFDRRLCTTDPPRAAAVTGIALNLILLCAAVFAPFLPATAASMRAQLRAVDPPLLPLIPECWTADDLKPGHEVGRAAHLFSPIDPTKEAEWRDRFGGTQAEREGKADEARRKEAKKAADKARKLERKLEREERAKAEKEARTLELKEKAKEEEAERKSVWMEKAMARKSEWRKKGKTEEGAWMLEWEKEAKAEREASLEEASLEQKGKAKVEEETWMLELKAWAKAREANRKADWNASLAKAEREAELDKAGREARTEARIAARLAEIKLEREIKQRENEQGQSSGRDGE